VFQCPGCGGRGCGDCDGKGTFDLASCPKEYATDDVWEMLAAADLAAKGLPPVAGGQLDQTKSFLQAARFIWNEQAAAKAAIGIQ